MALKRIIIFIFAVGLAAISIIINLPAGGKIKNIPSDFQNILSLIIYHISFKFKSIFDKENLLEKIEVLKRENIELKFKLQQLQQIKEENKKLKEIIGIPMPPDYRIVSARVIGRDFTGWQKTLRINKGGIDGITINAPVITPEGLIGKIIDVSYRYSDVLLITDPNCKVSCKIIPHNVFGILSGAVDAKKITLPPQLRKKSQKLLLLDYVDINYNLTEENTVLTSGLGENFPAGLNIGKAVGKIIHPSELYSQILVEANADFNDIMFTVIFIPIKNENSY